MTQTVIAMLNSRSNATLPLVARTLVVRTKPEIYHTRTASALPTPKKSIRSRLENVAGINSLLPLIHVILAKIHAVRNCDDLPSRSAQDLELQSCLLSQPTLVAQLKLTNLVPRSSIPPALKHAAVTKSLQNVPIHAAGETIQLWKPVAPAQRQA